MIIVTIMKIIMKVITVMELIMRIIEVEKDSLSHYDAHVAFLNVCVVNYHPILHQNELT